MAAISLVMQILPDGKHVKIGFDKFKYFPRVLISKLRIFDDNTNAYDVREADTSAKMRRRLELFYAAYNPVKLEEAGFLDNAIQTYAGKEEMLFARLVQQYGPEPAVPTGDSEPFAGSLGVNSEAQSQHVLKSSSPTKT